MPQSQIAQRHPHIAQKLDDACQTFRDIRRILPSLRRDKDFSIVQSPFPESRPNSLVWHLLEFHVCSRLKIMDFGLKDHGPPSMDGPSEKKLSRSRNAPVAAIFVHAGAGYHSTTNEHIHLSACSE